jgi:predicted permease
MKQSRTMSRLIYRYLLRLLPARFRATHGAEMESLFAEALDTARGAGRLVLLWAWLRGTADVVGLAVQLRLRRPRIKNFEKSPGNPLNSLLHDVHHAFRNLRRRPLFTAIAALTLGLGIGSTTTIYSTANSILLRSLPYEQPDNLVWVWGTSLEFGQRRDVISGPNYIDIRERNAAFESLAAFKSGDVTLFSEGVPVPTGGELVTPEFFSVLGIVPHLGRLFAPEDGRTGSNRTVVISHALWQNRYGADPSIIGRSVETIGDPFIVVGVLPKDAEFPFKADIFIPLAYDFLRERDRTSVDYWGIGRLKSGVSVAVAQTDLDVIMEDLERDDPRLRGWRFTVDPLQGALVEHVRPAILMLLGAVGLALLIACANVANLLLTRGVSRGRELAIRTSLGASRVLVARQLLTESVVLGLAGGVIGLALSVIAVSALPGILPATIPVPDSAANVILPSIGIDGTVLGFTVLVSLFTAMLFGLAPVFQAWRLDMNSALRESASTASASRHALRSQNLVIVGELALAVVLLSVTGLTLKSTIRLLRVDPGVDPRNLVTMYFGELNSWDAAERAIYYSRVIEAVEAVPGVVSVGINDYVPFQQEDDFQGFHIESRLEEGGHRTEWRRVSADYFETTGIPVIRGRPFSPADDERAPSVVVVNSAMARRYWPDEDPVGQRIIVHESVYGSSDVVGIVGDVRRRGLDQDAPPVMYLPYHRSPRPIMGLFARTAVDPESVIEPVRQAIWSVDPRQPVEAAHTVDEILAESVSVPRLSLFLAGVVAALALVLATVGVYSVVSYAVSQRHKEISIRMALGARSLNIQRTVLLSGLKLGLSAVALGIAGALVAGRVAAAALFGVKGYDPAPYVGAALLVVVVALVACYVPARRAAAIDPMRSLRLE